MVVVDDVSLSLKSPSELTARRLLDARAGDRRQVFRARNSLERAG